MRKRWLSAIVLGLLMLLAPAVVSAHTGLKSSSPAGGATVDKSPGEVTMEFNTDIEPLSTFEVRGETNELWKVSGIRIEKDKMSGKLESGLPNGTYTVKWSIIGRDGHPVENKFSFTVKLSEQAQASQPASGGSETKTAQPEASTAPAAETGGGGKTMTIAAMVLIAIIAAFAIVRMRKKGAGTK
ncbi:copper resistance CopC family protein [Paenibacillus ginsengarvi]|uniref:Copper resistance protein CopC n=1 Tax=Paenibacillus ginsengarvi TaxID=400777 RepID=A0A3B0CDN6_9BACL|nr:copper resistance CopC family protein [Paenibacillus ginsengarvi]RKN84255.1 copper resistance protein CopC [Paenibacillus ginsengarvi]